MLNKPTPTTNPRLETAIEELENSIVGGDPESDKYQKQVSTLKTLYELRDGKRPSKTELKDWIPVIGSLSAVVVIVIFEAFGHSVTSKAVGFVGKLKS
jgi:hypothetical protein